MAEMIARDGITIAATPSRIWEVLTRSEYTRQYMFGCEPVTDWRVGSALIWRGATDGKVYVKGTLVNVMPEATFAYTTFTPNAFDNYEDKPENYTTVTLTLTDSEAGTELSVCQGDFAGIASGALRFAHTVNSWRTVLTKIKAIAESA